MISLTLRLSLWCSRHSFLCARYTQGYLWTVANDPVLVGTLEAGTGLCADEFNRTDHFPPALYVRAARRLVGSKVFTQNTPKEQSLTGGIGNLSIGVGCCVLFLCQLSCAR